jgi:cation transport regulator
MPYGTISDLPDPVRKALPAHGQEIFLAAFNSAYGGSCKDDTDQEGCANAVAWSAVKKNYRKNGDEWTKIENLFSNSEPVTVHDVVFQRLDVFHNNNGGQVLYPAEQFRGNVPAWDGLPVVYDRGFATVTPSEHPGFEPMSSDLSLPEKSRFVKVGATTGAHIPETGEPVLKGQIAFTCPHCSKMAERGELSLSTGLSAPTMMLTNGKKTIAGQPVPNHILVFKRGGCPNCYPNDNGARFENLAGGDEMDEESKGLLKKILEKIEGFGAALSKAPAAGQTWDQCMAEQEKKNGLDLEASRAACGGPIHIKSMGNIMTEPKTDEALTNLKSEVERLTNQNAALKAANDEARAFHEKVMQENKDLKWAMLKNALPMAWKDTVEHETERRTQYEKDPAGFITELTTLLNQKPAEKAAEGEKMANIAPKDEGWGRITGTKKEKVT